jgi:hypothetical protein
MTAPTSPEAIWKLAEKDLLNLLESGGLPSKRKEIRFYAPSFTYYKFNEAFSNNFCDGNSLRFKL